jgi:hypothetical protein
LGAAAAVAVMRMKEREVRDDFIRAEATTPQGAKSLAEIGIDESRTVHRLQRRAVIREAAPGLLYFDEDVWQAVRSMRRRMALLLTSTIILIGLLVFYGAVTLK